MNQIKIFFQTPAGRVVKIILAVIFSCIIVFCLLVVVAINSDTPAAPQAQPTAAQDQPTLTPVNTLPPAQTNTPRPPTATADPLYILKMSTVKVLSDDPARLTDFIWSGSDKSLYIEFGIGDNFTSSLIVSGIQIDVTDMLKTVSQSGLLPDYALINISGTFPLVDKFGNTSTDMVLNLTYNRATIDKINWDNFLYSNILDIADSIFIHPALQTLMMEANQ